MIETYAKTDDGRKDYPRIADDYSRAHAILSSFEGKYSTQLIKQFPTLANGYKDVRDKYKTYYGTALKYFARCAAKSDPSFVLAAPTAPTTTAPNAPAARTTSTTAPASSAEVNTILQSISSLERKVMELSTPAPAPNDTATALSDLSNNNDNNACGIDENGDTKQRSKGGGETTRKGGGDNGVPPAPQSQEMVQYAYYI